MNQFMRFENDKEHHQLINEPFILVRVVSHSEFFLHYHYLIMK